MVWSAVKFALKRIGFSEFAARVAGSPAEDLSDRRDLLDELEELTDLSVPERHAGLIHLLEQYTFDSRVAAALVQHNFCNRRPIERALLAWDLLNNVHLERSEGELSEILRGWMSATPELLPKQNVYSVTLTPSQMQHSFWDSMAQRTDASRQSRLKRSIAAGESDLPEDDQSTLWRAAEQLDDVEALLALARCGAAASSPERWEGVLENLAIRADGLAFCGLTTWASCLLLVLVELSDSSWPATRLVELYTERRQFSAAERILDGIGFAEDAADEDDRVGLRATLALRREQYAEAEELLGPWLAREIENNREFAEDYPRIVCACVEFALISQRAEFEILHCLPELEEADPENRTAARFGALIDYTQQMHEHGADPALEVFVPLLSGDPADTNLWQLFIQMIKEAGATQPAVGGVLAELLALYPQSVIVWSVIGATGVCSGELWQEINDALVANFLAQTSLS